MRKICDKEAITEGIGGRVTFDNLNNEIQSYVRFKFGGGEERERERQHRIESNESLIESEHRPRLPVSPGIY